MPATVVIGAVVTPFGVGTTPELTKAAEGFPGPRPSLAHRLHVITTIATRFREPEIIPKLLSIKHSAAHKAKEDISYDGYCSRSASW
jgi:hypothetical protein